MTVRTEIGIRRFSGISCNGYTLRAVQDKLYIVSNFGYSFEIDERAFKDIFCDDCPRADFIKADMEKAFSAFKIRDEVLKIALASHSAILNTEKNVRGINERLQSLFNQLCDYGRDNPRYFEKGVEYLEDMIKSYVENQQPTVENTLDPKSVWGKLKNKFVKNVVPDELKKNVRGLRSDVQQNQELFVEFIASEETTFAEIVMASQAKCDMVSQNVQVQTDTLKIAKLEKIKALRRVAFYSIRYAVNKKLIEYSTQGVPAMARPACKIASQLKRLAGANA